MSVFDDKEPLGRLTRVDLRDIWSHEASDFTPWLAQEHNLAILSEALGIDLELEAQEKSVGPFRADILCKDMETSARVLVENQLEQTDHRHLGQLLTYASGLSAVTIVWIAARFTEEHRSTLDWLNNITDESFRFFGLEVELWRIGDSLAAPKFNVVSKPNNWSRSIAQVARTLDESALSEKRVVQLAYWCAFHDALHEAGGPVSGNRKAQAQSWMEYVVGNSNFYLIVAIKYPTKQLYTGLFIKDDSKTLFHYLQDQKDDIEQDFDYPLVWEELPNRKGSRIAVYRDNVDPEDRQDWPNQHAWLAAKINDFHRVFADRIKSLKPGEGPPDQEDD